LQGGHSCRIMAACGHKTVNAIRGKARKKVRPRWGEKILAV
jgi:translation initiation factor IF-1